MRGLGTLGLITTSCWALLVALPVSAETVYIDDMLRVGVRPEPNSSVAPLEVVTTGHRLEVLERRDGYLLVRTQRGVEGWISEAYATAELPARERVKELVVEKSQLEESITELRRTAAAALEENQRLSERLAELESEAGQAPAVPVRPVESEVERTTPAFGEQALLLKGAALILLFLAGFLFGSRWYRHRVTERLGGLEI